MQRYASVATCAVLAVIMVSLVTACGQKGPLRLPAPAAPPASAATGAAH